MTTENVQTKHEEEEEEEEEHETCSPELPQPLSTRRQAEEDLQNNTFGRCSHKVIPVWAKKISLLFTPRGVMRPFASDIQKPRVKANTYNTSELLSALSLPSVSVECATTSCQNKANRLIQQKTEQEYVTQENDNMYSADYMYSIHILNGKRAHPLISAMAVLFANELEKLLRVPFVLVHLYNNSINTLVMLQREKQKVQGPTFEKSHVCNDLDNLNRRTHENTNNYQSMNVSALSNGSSKVKIINVQNTSQLTNSVCNVINNESTLRTSNSAFPCSTNESSLISRDMASARSVSALTTSFPFQCSANNSSAKVEKNATLLESKLRPSTHKNSRASWFQLVPVGSIICEDDEYDNNNNKNNNVINDNNKLECAHTGQANKTTTARKRTKNVNKKKQINTKSESCRNKFSTNAHLISQHHTEAGEHNPRHTQRVAPSQMVSEEEPHNTTGSFTYAENGTESSMPSSWEACSSLCNSTASLSEPQLPPPQLPSSSTLELQELELNSKKEMFTNANESKTCLNSERQEHAYAHEYAQNALLRILTNQYSKESQAHTQKSDIICKENNKHGNSNDDITNRNSTSHTDAAYWTNKVVNQSTNKSLQPEQMNSSANNTTSASSSAAAVAYNNNSSTLPESTEDITSISLTSPRMIIHSTPRSMISKHARVSVKNSCNWPAGGYDKANSSCTLSNNDNDHSNSNSSKKNDTEIVGSSNLMNMRDSSIADKLKAGANSKVYNPNGNARNVQGPPTLHLYRGAKTSASSLPEVNKKEKEVQDTLHCEYAHKTTDQSKSTVTSQHSNSELPNCIRESNTNNTQKDNEADTHFTRESNQLHHMSMTDVINDENGESRGEENKLREKSFTKAGTVLLHSDAEDIKKNASEDKTEREACTNNTENNKQVIVHENGDRKVPNEDQDEDDEVRMTDDRIRK